MATIKPFRAVRPKDNELAGRIAALPYDVYNRQEAKAEITREPLSFLRVDRAETNFSEEVDIYADCVYEKAKEILQDMMKCGTLVMEDVPFYYVYELTMNGRTQTGIVACADIDDYENGVIKKHENTRADKEIDRIRHVDTCNMQTGPIFLAYRSIQIVNEIVSKTKQTEALYDLTAEDGIRHRVWTITNQEEIITIQKAFESTQQIYIADGHHRCASAVKVGLKRRKEHPDYTGTEEFNSFLSVLFPHDQLMIMDYNRVVQDLNGLSVSAFMERLKEVFEIEPKGTTAYHPLHKGEVSMFLAGQWYGLSFLDTLYSSHPIDGLDVSKLQNYVLEPILNIKDPKTDQRIDFVGGIRGLSELEQRVRTDSAVAFAMYPTSIQELFAVSDADLLMPPKSTWFEPKLRSGLLLHSIL
ncbi:MAG: DUF1015 domain-containing protein [Lachnospiraceae bacterium]